MTLLANYYNYVTISVATTSCSGSTAITVLHNIACNLKPWSNGDVDLGAASGIPIPPTTTGSSISVPVYVYTTGAILKAFQIRLRFNSSQLLATACTSSGSNWAGSFTCTIGDPATEVLLIGSDVASTYAGADKTVATITMRAVGTNALARISGQVESISIGTSSPCSASQYCTIQAGDVSVQIGTVTAKAIADHTYQIEDSKKYLTKSASKYREGSGNKATCSVDAVLGDMDLDCVFDIQDVTRMQYFYVKDATVSPLVTADVQKKMDVTLNGGSPDAVDIQYLLTTLAKQRRFLIVDSSFPVISDRQLNFTVTVKNELGVGAVPPQTTVKYEVRTTLNKVVSVASGTNFTLTSNGFMITATHIGSGIYQSLVNGPFVAESSAVVIMVETSDAAGASSAGKL